MPGESEIVGGYRPIELLLSGNFKDNFQQALTDEDGHFELTGLLDKTYSVLAVDTQTLHSTMLPEVQAGTSSVTLTLNRQASWGEVEVRLVYPTGAPMEGARVRLMTVTTSVQGPGGTFPTAEVGSEFVTKEDGLQTFEAVPTNRIAVLVKHPRAYRMSFDLYGDEVRELERSKNKRVVEIVVARRVNLQLQLGDTDMADSFEILDSSGAPIQVRSSMGGSTIAGPQVKQLYEGNSISVFVEEGRALTLVLRKEGAEVKRSELNLKPDSENVLHL